MNETKKRRDEEKRRPIKVIIRKTRAKKKIGKK
jgi:hypothetical protein